MKRVFALLILFTASLLFSSSESQAAEKAFLGVVPDKATRVEADEFTGTGLRISKIVDGGPAEKAGMRSGDILTHFAGKPIKDGDDLSFFLRKVDPGDEVELRWVHNRAVKEGTAVLISTDEPEVKFQIMGKDLVSTFDNRAFLGISTLSINKNLLDHFGVVQGHGILIDSVVRGSAAETAGLQVGDVLVEIDGSAVDSPGRLRRLIQKYKPGSQITLTVVRDRISFNLPVALGDRDMSDASPRLRLPADPNAPALPGLPEMPQLPERLRGDVRLFPGMKGIETSCRVLKELFGAPLACAKP